VEIRDARTSGATCAGNHGAPARRDRRGAKVACIGPAGEKGVLFAAIMNDMHRAAGRSGSAP